MRPEVRAALWEGVEVGVSAAGGEEGALLAPPYSLGEDTENAWRCGWWAGLFASEGDPEPREARLRMAARAGELRPVGGLIDGRRVPAGPNLHADPTAEEERLARVGGG